jgi:hypothetical protein
MRFFKHILLALALASPAFANTNINTRNLQESLDSIDNWLGALAASAGATNVQVFLPGTNIVGASYNSGTEQWAIDWTQILTQYPLLDVNYTDDASLTSTALVQGAVFRAYVPPGDYLSVTNFTNSVLVSDSANGWNSTNQTYTVPTDGYYLIGVAYEPNLSTGGGPGTNDNWTIESAVGASIAVSFADGTTNNTLFTFRADSDGSSAPALDAMGTVPLFLTNNSKVFLYKRHGGSTATLGGNMNWFVSAIGGGGGGTEYVVDAYWTNTINRVLDSASVTTNFSFDSGWVNFVTTSLFNPSTGTLSLQTNKKYVVDFGINVAYTGRDWPVRGIAGLVKNTSWPSGNTWVSKTNLVVASTAENTVVTSFDSATTISGTWYSGLVTNNTDYYRFGLSWYRFQNGHTLDVSQGYIKVREVD